MGHHLICWFFLHSSEIFRYYVWEFILISFFWTLVVPILLCLTIFVHYFYHSLSNCFNLLVLFSPHSLWLCQAFPQSYSFCFSAGSISFHLAVSNLFIRCVTICFLSSVKFLFLVLSSPVYWFLIYFFYFNFLHLHLSPLDPLPPSFCCLPPPSPHCCLCP